MKKAPFDLQSEQGFLALHEAIYESSEAFSSANKSLAESIQKQSNICKHPGFADSKSYLVQVMVNQVYGEFHKYYEENPTSQIDAVCWIQKVFVMCRMFGSETWVEPNQRSRFVGKMIDPKSKLTFGEITALDKIELAPEQYGTTPINDRLHELVTKALNNNQPTQAVRLLCDSVKHGVLSAAINLSVLKTAQQIYLIGLMAMTESVNHYLTRAEQTIKDSQQSKTE